MENKKLKTPNYTGLNIYCYECMLNVKKSMCNHYSKHIYKYRTKDNFGKARFKNFTSKDLDAVLQEIICFKKEIEKETIQVKEAIKPTNMTLRDALVCYGKWLNNIDVPDFLIRKIGKDHAKDLVDTVVKFLKVLNENGVNPSRTLVTNVNLTMVGYYCDWLKYTKEYEPVTYNGKVIKMRAFFKHVIEVLEIKMNNPFKLVPAKQVPKGENVIIEREEFAKLIDGIGKVTPYQQLGGKNKEVKTRYKPYLKDAFKLALYSGMRREEWATLQWSDIQYSDNGRAIIVVDNKKVERITKKQVDPTIVPVHPKLAILLKELGQDDLKDSNLFIIEPNRTCSCKAIMQDASKGFSHYYKEVFKTNEIKQMKCLRKTYMTELKKHTGENILEFGTHNKNKVLDNHYLNKVAIAKTIDNDKFFG